MSSSGFEKTYKVVFKTADGCLVMEKLDVESFYISTTFGGKVKFSDSAEKMLNIDCRRKGVKLVSYTWDSTGINAIVEWL